MLRDPLQERLYRMEMENPSENYHSKSLLGWVADRIYFLGRYLRDEVEEYPEKQRQLDEALEVAVAAMEEANEMMRYRGSWDPSSETPLSGMADAEKIHFILTGERPARLSTAYSIL